MPDLQSAVPLIDRIANKVSMKEKVVDFAPQPVITKDNVSVKVNAVVYFRVVDPEKAIIQVENFMQATSELAQTTLRSILGQFELDELLSAREKINENLQKILDKHTLSLVITPCGGTSIT